MSCIVIFQLSHTSCLYTLFCVVQLFVGVKNQSTKLVS